MKNSPSPTPSANAPASGAHLSAKGGSIRSVFKASALIGSSAVVSAVLGALRAKTLAVLLGPAGVGLMGAFTMIQELARNLARLGLNQSGVRQIAEAASTGDEQRLAITALVLRRTIILCAFLGAIFLWAIAGQVSSLTFGTKEQADSISLLAVALFLTVVADGQGALLQGMRRMKDVAKLSVYTALSGTTATVLIVYFTGERGIVPSLLAAAVAYIGISWWFSHTIAPAKAVPNAAVLAGESAHLFKLGLAFLASGLLMSGAAYVVRTFIIRLMGIEAAGIYQAAWTLGGLYVGFVLQALAMDFYPRLVGVIDDHHICNDTVNEQTTVSMLLAAPGIIGTITFAPLVIYLFYSSEFSDAVVLLRWICIGMALRIIVFPMGFIIVAKNQRLAFFTAEAAWAAINVASTWWGLRTFGLEGAAIAFLLTNVIHGIIVYGQARAATGFQWTRENLRSGASFVFACLLTFVLQRILPQWPAFALGAFITFGSLWFCARRMIMLTGASPGMKGLRGILSHVRKG